MKKEDAVRELERATKAHSDIVEQRITLEKWCLTIWVAILVAIVSEKVHVDLKTAMIILMTPILLFWCLATLYGSIMIRREKLIMFIERILATEDYVTEKPGSIYLFLHEYNLPKKQKIADLFEVLVNKETISIIYLLLLLFSGFILNHLNSNGRLQVHEIPNQSAQTTPAIAPR